MQTESLNTTYHISKNVVARNIAGELIIVPLVAGIADIEETLFTLNSSGIIIWEKLAEGKTLQQIITELNDHFDAPEGNVERDVFGLVSELERRTIIEKNLT